MSAHRRAARLAALAGAAALALAGCSGGAPPPSGGAPTTLSAPPASPSAPGEAASDPADAAYYGQRPAWTGCGVGLQCAQVRVPVDWTAPGGAWLQLALARRPATDPARRLGALVVDPGGPGASGVDYVRAGAAASPAVAARYDVVGVDPRGVGASAPVHCLPDPAFDAYLADPADPATPQGLAEATGRDRAFAAGCEQRSGALLGHVGTVDAARDLDVVRDALGSPRLDYLGKSYGTLLGAEYARRFPQRVGRFVLDGALDPASSASDVTFVQAEGLEQALGAYAAACGDRGGCPLTGGTAVRLSQVRAVLDAAQRAPLPAGGPRPLTGPLAFTGVVAALYDDRTWPVLDAALTAAQHGDGSRLLALADAYSGRRPDGTYSSNLLEAFTAVTCLDRPVDAAPAAMAAQAAQLDHRAPTLGHFLAYGDLQCGVWPVAPTRAPSPVRAQGAAPVLVVGTTGDPATPYRWARALAGELASGRLLTWHGQGHTAYLRGSACVDGAVDGYLLDAVLPGPGATCGS